MSTPFNPNNNQGEFGPNAGGNGAAPNSGDVNYAPNQGGVNPGAYQQGQPLGSRRLHRSANNRMLGGVCGGIAETYNLDPTLVRVIFVALTVLGFSGLLLYIICWIVIPDNRY